MMVIIVFYLFTATGCLVASEKKVNKYVSTLINAKWKDTPVFLEVAEYLNDENPKFFWEYVEEVSRRSAEFQEISKPKDKYDLVMSISKKFLTEARIRLMKLGLSLRIYSAKVEMFFKMAEENTNFFNNCYNFIDVGGEFICDLEEVKLYVENNSSFTSDTYSIDHFYNGKNNVNKTFILYGLIGTSGFLQLHTYLRSLAESNKINYVLRHHAKVRAHQNLRLSGYGVELQIKSTEYKASNDLEVNNNENQSKENTKKEINDASGINFSLLENLSPVKRKDLNKLQKYVSENIHEVGSLKIWQFQELSHQAAYKIISSLPSEVINILTEISQNFPMQAKSLLKLKISDEMKKEIKLNQDVFLANLNIQPSDTVLFVNGIFFDVETIDVLTLLESLRSELKIMESFYKIGIDKEEIHKLLTLELSTDVDTLDYAIDIRDSAIIWLNDIENDSKYYRWSPYLTELLRPSFPGRIRNVRRNIYNLVLILDPTNKTSLSLISLIESLYSTQLRIGLVFLTNFDMTISGATDASIAINNAFHYFMDNKTPDDAIKFLFSLHNNYSDGLIVNDVEMAVKNIDPKLNLDEIFNKESDYDVGRRLAKDFIEKTGFKAFPQALFNGVPLSTKLENVDILKETILSMVMSQTLMIQKAIIRGEVTEDDDVVDFLMNQTNVLPRFNERILKPKENCWLNTVGSIPENIYYEKWNSEDLTAWMIKNLQYLYAPKKTAQYHLYTLWLTIDLHLISGRKLLKEALDYLKSNADVRLSVILYDSKLHESKVNINKIALAAISALNVKKSYKYIYDLISGDTFQSISNGTFLIEDSAIQQNLQNQEFVLQVHNYYSSKVLGVQDSNNVIVYNGRIIGPLRENEEFTSEDFTLLERLSHNFYGDKIFNFILKNDFFKKSHVQKNLFDDLLMKVVSILVSRPQYKNRFEVPFHSDKFSVIDILADRNNAVAFNLVAIVDPVSRGAQKLGAILNVLRQTLNCNIRIFFNCVEKNSDVPLKSFYRYVIEPELQFSSDGIMIGAMAKFTNLPTSSLLTQNIHVPENWLVEVIQSIHDLDNIRLDSVTIGIHSEFELEHLLLEGHCFEALVGSPPRGLQITLGSKKQPMMVDTIVMANLGYFQLKANPGEWLLKLRQGRSAEIYDILSVEGSDMIYQEKGIKILMSTLRSNVIKLKVSKKLDKVNMDLLLEEDEDSGIWNSISRTFASLDDKDEQEEKVNIFSLASGHLYERFLKIMVLSIVKNTKSLVKFWFLKNYLSPTLKNFLPHMAREYGFEYELIQYKWPRWLHQQTEKQRTIWGYKILFLDVLFPLDVKKIIFVDADQVVRADLKELVKMDLAGAPYAYPPFCDSRKEMDGFRFWKQGYWKNHLQGRSYHISALYIVDLKRFRRIAAGDRLRGQYQALSQDPNSLSNLDQDLPNNMIHQVAIKTLPQEWLWCETWCDNESKKHAKTIDLCNNPMTKEAKLQAAVRILPEWTMYDNEIKSLQFKIENENRVTKIKEFNEKGHPQHEEL